VSHSIELLLPIGIFFISFFLALFIFKALNDRLLKWMDDLD